MQPLPYIQLIGFLDWIDKNGFAKRAGITIEEFFLDRASGEQTYHLAEQYINTLKKYPDTEKGHFEQKVDYLLAEIKNLCMQYYTRRQGFIFHRDISISDIYMEERYSIERIIKKYDYDRRNHYQYESNINAYSLVESIRVTLEWDNQGGLKDYLKNTKGTATNIITKYVSYFQRKVAKNADFDKMPVRIVEQFIDGFLEEEYRCNRINQSEIDFNRDILNRVLFGEMYTDYYKNLINIRSVSERYWERTARCKCLFLAEDRTFYELVEKHWEVLNDYSGKYLDIFYTPEELTQKGYKTADKLNIRGMVTDYPSIFIWKTSLDTGKCISVKQLPIEDLLLLIKYIVDEISEEKTLEQIAVLANEKVRFLQEAINSQFYLEQSFIKNLLKATITMQGNPEVYGNATEDQRNTQIRDLLSAVYQNSVNYGGNDYHFTVHDQTRIGWSAKRKRAGELDLFIKVNNFPYAIIEGIIVEEDNEGRHWNRTNLMEHVRRIGNYDQNGLRRNVLLVYAETDHFSNFCDSLFKAMENSPNCNIQNSQVHSIRNITDKYTENANVCMAQAEYDYNSQTRTLYIIVVGFEKLSVDKVLKQNQA